MEFTVRNPEGAVRLDSLSQRDVFSNQSDGGGDLYMVTDGGRYVAAGKTMTVALRSGAIYTFVDGTLVYKMEQIAAAEFKLAWPR